MVARTDTYTYEVSSESGRERMVLLPWTRLSDATPTLGDPACGTSLLPGTNLVGTVVNAGVVADPYVVMNIAACARYWHNVRNVLTYAGGGAEATWTPINIGDPVYYDAGQDALNGIKLSMAPLAAGGVVANPLFGFIGMRDDETAASFPRGTNAIGSTDAFCVVHA